MGTVILYTTIGTKISNFNADYVSAWYETQYEDFIKKITTKANKVSLEIVHDDNKKFEIHHIQKESDIEYAYRHNVEDEEELSVELMDIEYHKSDKYIDDAVNEITKIIKDAKDDIEIECFKRNMAEEFTSRVDNGNGDTESLEGLITLSLMKIKEDSKYTSYDQILTIMEDMTIPTFLDINKALEKNFVTVEDDLTITIDPTGNNATTHNGLKDLKEEGQRHGLELVYSNLLVSSTDQTWGLKNEDGEEYHYIIADIISSQPEKLIQKAISAFDARQKLKTGIFKDLDKVFVGIDDSIDAGNCQAGTMEFLKRHNLDPKKIGGIRADELLNIKTDKFTKAVVLNRLRKVKSSTN